MPLVKKSKEKTIIRQIKTYRLIYTLIIFKINWGECRERQKQKETKTTILI